jgi:hypothetical protein
LFLVAALAALARFFITFARIASRAPPLARLGGRALDDHLLDAAHERRRSGGRGGRGSGRLRGGNLAESFRYGRDGPLATCFTLGLDLVGLAILREGTRENVVFTFVVVVVALDRVVGFVRVAVLFDFFCDFAADRESPCLGIHTVRPVVVDDVAVRLHDFRFTARRGSGRHRRGAGDLGNGLDHRRGWAGLTLFGFGRFFRGAVVFLGAFTSGQVRLEIVGTDEIFDVQKCRTFLADVDERSLHSGENPGHLADDDVT